MTRRVDAWTASHATLPPGAYDPTPDQQRKAALYVCDRLADDKPGLRIVLAALGLTPTRKETP